jgi:branched-subunit amino acid transport protein
MNAYIAIAAVALGSYLLRVSMIVLTARVGVVPPLIERAARYAIPVSFAALAADAFAPHLGFSRAAIAPAVTLVVAILAVRWTRSPHAALIAGLPTLWIVTALTS